MHVIVAKEGDFFEVEEEFVFSFDVRWGSACKAQHGSALVGGSCKRFEVERQADGAVGVVVQSALYEGGGEGCLYVSSRYSGIFANVNGELGSTCDTPRHHRGWGRYDVSDLSVVVPLEEAVARCWLPEELEFSCDTIVEIEARIGLVVSVHLVGVLVVRGRTYWDIAIDKKLVNKNRGTMPNSPVLESKVDSVMNAIEWEYYQIDKTTYDYKYGSGKRYTEVHCLYTIKENYLLSSVQLQKNYLYLFSTILLNE